ncbi:LytTR family DNA-binding domain-containing protein [Candidatus Sulfidibacterium hydrothermale]|uniref:LytR/AlgR family response regulator transcription factor n=1 Tax=Candidatus Sulfidibacterium hydrothermale TaxID=2875962 RepID=UPI001F0AE8FC|nr:LytTR family DNA-binding domain-containing protein [Candidatus Sulfidibacterium hydrothermale]UBM62108.1 LytTR family DNA-binding domain-containing protein [Candidatus Sulfidibacterium hydrothermale]
MNNPIPVLIVDDEQDSRDGLEILIRKHFPELSVIAKAETAQQALEIIVDQVPEIIFLDVQMPVHDGFWLVEKLKMIRVNVCVIFVTAYDEYVIQALRHAAFDFLTKPVETDKLKDAIDRFQLERSEMNLNRKLDRLETYMTRGKIRFNTLDGFIMVAPEEIVYCEADKNYSYIHLTNGKSHLITAQLGTLGKRLKNRGAFIRISRSALINLNFLESYRRKSKTVVLSDILQKYELKASGAGSRKLLSL